MSEQINSAAELDAPRYLRMVKCTERSCGTRVRYGELTDDANTHWHVRPGVALVTIPDQPQRVQPSQEDVAEAILAHFHAPDSLHGTWWLQPRAAADAVLALFGIEVDR